MSFLSRADEVDPKDIERVFRKLDFEKGTLDRDIRKLERQLITEKRASKEKKTLNPCQDNM